MDVAGVPVTAITPLVLNQGNVTVAFATFTYAGKLTISVAVDPDHGPDPDDIARLLRHSLELLAG